MSALTMKRGPGDVGAPGEWVELAGATLDIEVQRAMAQDPDQNVRAGLAGNPQLAAEIQHLLLLDPGLSVRLRLGRNANLVPEIQALLARDDCTDLRKMVAINSRAVAAVQRILAEDPEWAVRGCLGRNLGLLPELACTLAEDPDARVRKITLGNSNLALHHGMSVALLQSRRRGAEYLERELDGCDPSVRDALAPTWTGTLEELLVAARVLS